MKMDFAVAPIKPTVSVRDLERIDIRVGTILSVEDVAGSDKLLKLTVDFGDHQRGILAGMKQERWGEFTLVRPDPQVIWPRHGTEKAGAARWEQWDGLYHRSETGGHVQH